MLTLGFDTSNYTTSVAAFDGVGGKNCSRLLDVKPGELGLRQSDALFAHIKRLPELVAGHFLDNPASGAVLRKLGFRPTGKVAQRYSVARGGEAACALFEEGDGDGSNAVTPMRGRIDIDADFREEIRLIAA